MMMMEQNDNADNNTNEMVMSDFSPEAFMNVPNDSLASSGTSNDESGRMASDPNDQTLKSTLMDNTNGQSLMNMD
jgi:hypothetical protein